MNYTTNNMNLVNLGRRDLMMILNHFLDNPKEISQTNLLKKTKLSKATVIKWVSFLEKEKFLNARRIGNTKLLELTDGPITKQFKILNALFKLRGIEKLRDKNVEIYLYGSAARGETHEESDIDILIIGNIKRNEIIDIIDIIQKKNNIKINFQIFTHIEWSKMLKNDKAYFERVEKDKIRLI